MKELFIKFTLGPLRIGKALAYSAHTLTVIILNYYSRIVF